MLSAPDVVVVGLRALSFVAIFQATGSVLFLWIFKRQLTITAEPLIKFAAWAAWSAIALTLAHHFLGPARMTGSFSGVFDSSLQWLLLESGAGSARALRIGGLALLAFAIRAKSRRGSAAALLGVALAVVSFGLMGHTATDDLRWLLAPLLIVHLLIISFWFGSLLPLLYVTAREGAAVGGTVLDRFSSLATWSVPIILVAGIVMAIVLLPSFADLLTPYGRLVLAKISGFAVLMGLATLNKWRFVPAIRAGESRSVLGVQRSIALEWSVMVLVFVITAVMTGFFSPGH